MRPEQQLFAMALGLGEPWEVQNINFDAETSRLDIKIDFAKASLFACPECGKMCGVKDSKEKTWRHLNFFQHECYLTARTPRTNCDEHGVHQVDVPWARERSGFTLLFEAFVMALLKKMPVKSVAQLLNIHDTQLWRVFNHYISKTRQSQDYSDVSKVGIDETSSKKRHKYISLFVDLDKRKLLFGTSGRKAEVVKTFADDLKEHKGNPKNVTVACCDLSPSFTSGVKKHLKNAKLTYDKFHIIKLVNQAMDEVRRSEVSKKSEYKKTRYILLKNPKNLTIKQKQKLETITKDNSEIARAYNLKITFSDLFACQNKEAAELFLQKWINWAQRSRLQPFVKLKKTISKHKAEILNWFDSKVSNGILEGINSLVQNARNRARGYRNDTNFINMCYLIAGKW